MSEDNKWDEQKKKKERKKSSSVVYIVSLARPALSALSPARGYDTFTFSFCFFFLSIVCFFCFLFFVERVCRACRIQYDGMALHCRYSAYYTVYILHNNVLEISLWVERTYLVRNNTHTSDSSSVHFLLLPTRYLVRYIYLYACIYTH